MSRLGAGELIPDTSTNDEQSLALAGNEAGPQGGSDTQVSWSSRTMLVASFLLAFFVATSAFILIGHFGFNTPRSLSIAPDEYTADREASPGTVFPVRRSGVYKRVSAHQSLNPSAGADYICFVWFRLRKVPSISEYSALVGKFQMDVPVRPGYAISLEGTPDGARPRVYWKNALGQGRWYSFASRPLRRGEWYLLVVSFSDDKFLAAYLTDIGSELQPFVGGYRVEPTVVASSNADLIVGAYGSSKFRGDIGPFGVLSAEGLQERLREYIEEMRRHPFTRPSAIPAHAVKLWASPDRDEGPQSLVIGAGADKVKEIKPKKQVSKASKQGKSTTKGVRKKATQDKR